MLNPRLIVDWYEFEVQIHSQPENNSKQLNFNWYLKLQCNQFKCFFWKLGDYIYVDALWFIKIKTNHCQRITTQITKVLGMRSTINRSDWFYPTSTSIISMCNRYWSDDIYYLGTKENDGECLIDYIFRFFNIKNMQINALHFFLQIHVIEESGKSKCCLSDKELDLVITVPNIDRSILWRSIEICIMFS